MILSYQESLIPKGTVNVNGRSVQVFLTSLPFGMYQFSVGSTNNVNFGANWYCIPMLVFTAHCIEGIVFQSVV